MIDHWGGVFRQSEDSSQTGVSSSRPSRDTHSLLPKTEIPTSKKTDIFLKRTQLLFRYFSFISCSLSKSSQCSVEDLTQQEHLHIFAQIFATFLTRSFLAGMFDGREHNKNIIIIIIILCRHVRWARAHSQAVALLTHHLP